MLRKVLEVYAIVGVNNSALGREVWKGGDGGTTSSDFTR